MIDLLTMQNFLDGPTRDAILAELRAAGGAPATVYGGAVRDGGVEPRVRSTTRVQPSDPTRELVLRRLWQQKPALEQHFGLALTQCDEPQFLHYRAGDFFVAHQDGNTPLMRFDELLVRRVSVVIFLSPSEAYGGGALVFHGNYAAPDFRLPAFAEPGTLVAFRAETTHEVTPVTHGERYTIASWFR